MKVNIGPYTKWIGPYQIADMVFFWLDKHAKYDAKMLAERWDYKLHEHLGNWLADTWVNRFCNWVDSKKTRKINIRIDKYDTWNMNHTLAMIILPMLVQLRDTKHGAPFVDDEDVPEDLRSTSAPELTQEQKDCGSTDDFFFMRWDWVIDEMIWAFNQELDDSADNQFHSGESDHVWVEEEFEGETFSKLTHGPNHTHKFDKEGWEKWNERKRNGFRLFGKYYQGLWD